MEVQLKGDKLLVGGRKIVLRGRGSENTLGIGGI
jgi:hypothetical protein